MSLWSSELAFATYKPRLPGRSVEPPEPPPAESVLCACGCGRDVQPDVYEHYKDEDGNVFFDLDCVMRYYGIRCVD